MHILGDMKKRFFTLMNTMKKNGRILEIWVLARIHSPCELFMKMSKTLISCLKKQMSGFNSYLQIRDNFAQCVSKEPRLCDVYHKTRRQADDGDQHISQGKIHYEIVCHGAHVTVLPYCKTN